MADLDRRRSADLGSAAQGGASAGGGSWGRALAAEQARAIERAADAERAAVEDVRVEHGRGYVAMPEQLLDRADVVPAFEEIFSQRFWQGDRAGTSAQVGVVQRAHGREMMSQWLDHHERHH